MRKKNLILFHERYQRLPQTTQDKFTFKVLFTRVWCSPYFYMDA